MSAGAKRTETCSVCGETWNVSVKLNLDDYWGFYICPACRAQLFKKEKTPDRRHDPEQAYPPKNKRKESLN